MEGDPEGGASAAGRPKQKARKSKPAAARNKKQAAAKADNSETFMTASPGLSSSVSSGVMTFSAAAESTAAVSSGDTAATTSASLQPGAAKAETETEMEMESFSSAEFPPIDESFWSSPDVVDMGLGAMDEELGLASPPSAATRDEDMEFWLKMLLESGDMRDLSVVL